MHPLRRTDHRRPPAAVLAVLLLSGLGVAPVAPADTCGSLANAYGPFDYTDPRNRQPGLGGGSDSAIGIVERAHYSMHLDLGGHLPMLLGDLDYTLRAIPNHHGALLLIVELAERHGGELPQNQATPGHAVNDWPRTVDCYFDRAIRWRPNDGLVRQLVGIRYFRRGKFADAIAAFDEARRLGVTSAELDYNTGLAYLRLGDLDKAYTFAKSAYANGYPLPGLRNRLTEAGRWP